MYHVHVRAGLPQATFLVHTRARVPGAPYLCWSRMSKCVITTAGLGAGAVEAALLLLLLVLSGSQQDAWLLSANCRPHSSYNFRRWHVGTQHKKQGHWRCRLRPLHQHQASDCRTKAQPLQTHEVLFSLHTIDRTKRKPLPQHYAYNIMRVLKPEEREVPYRPCYVHIIPVAPVCGSCFQVALSARRTSVGMPKWNCPR